MWQYFLKSLLETNKEWVGYAEEPLLIRAGERAGRFYIRDDTERIKQEFKKVDMELDIMIKDGEVRCTVLNSFEGRIRNRAEKPICFMLKGFFIEIWRNKLHSHNLICEEIECISKGDEKCVFLLKERGDKK